MARGKNEIRSLTQSKLRRAFRMLYPGEQPSAYPDKELRARIVAFYGGSHKEAEIGVAASLEAGSRQVDSGNNQPTGTSEQGSTSAADATMPPLVIADGQPLTNEDLHHFGPSYAAIAATASGNTAETPAPVNKAAENTASHSAPDPSLRIQDVSYRAARSFDDIVPNTAVPGTKSKRSSWAGDYRYDDANEQIVKDVKRTTFLLPSESGDPQKSGVCPSRFSLNQDDTDIASFKQQTALTQVVIAVSLPGDISLGSTAAVEYVTSQLAKADAVITHCLTTKGTGPDVYGNLLGVSRFEASCEDKMKIDRLSEKVAELDARLAVTEGRLIKTEKKHDEGKAEWDQKRDEDKKRIEELEAKMRDLHPTRRGMRRVRKRCVLDFKRQKSTKSGAPESEDDRKARMEGNGEAHDGNCIADMELCVAKADMPGLDGGDQSLIEEIYGFSVNQIRQVQADKVMTSFIDLRGSFALDRNLSMMEGKDMFKLINDLYHRRQLWASGYADNEKLARLTQLENEAAYVALLKAIEQQKRKLNENARARREQALR